MRNNLHIHDLPRRYASPNKLQAEEADRSRIWTINNGRGTLPYTNEASQEPAQPITFSQQVMTSAQQPTCFQIRLKLAF